MMTLNLSLLFRDEMFVWIRMARGEKMGQCVSARGITQQYSTVSRHLTCRITIVSAELLKWHKNQHFRELNKQIILS
jgi:hypothetical protein